MNTSALKESWAQVAESGSAVPMYFYSHLFVSQPQLRSLFPISMSAQRERLVSALGRIVSNVDQLDQVVGFIEQLGRDHRKFSVVTENYSAVGASLLATLQHFLGSGWTPELAADWSTAYGLIAKTMAQAAEDSADVTPDWWQAEVVSVERRTIDLAVITVRSSQPIPYRAGQSLSVEVPHRPRLWRYLSPANRPNGDGLIVFHVQLIDGGQVSPAIVRKLQPGDQIKLGAPVGEQLQLPADAGDLLLVAGGTGLAPLRALIDEIDCLERGGASVGNVVLYHGVRVPWSLYENDALTDLARRPWLTYVPVVSEDDSYPGQRGLVGTAAAGTHDLAGRLAMVCGPPAMVEHSVAELRAAGLSADAIRYEKFQLGSPTLDASE